MYIHHLTIITIDPKEGYVTATATAATKNGHEGYKELIPQADGETRPAYIETISTDAPFLTGTITHKNAAMKRWTRKYKITAYNR